MTCCDLFLLRRISDGAYYRGAIFWRWTTSWRRAAVLPKSFWVEFYGEFGGCEVVHISDAIHNEQRTGPEGFGAVSGCKTPLSDFQREVGEWACATFPTATPDSWVAHLKREVVELADSHASDEAADCLILLLGHAHKNGFDLMEAAQAKMEVNCKRKWGKPDSEGVVEHICENEMLSGSGERKETNDHK